MAPKASLVVVKMDQKKAGSSRDAIEYIARTAASLDQPWVINYSLGNPYTKPTARDRSSELEQFIDTIIASSETAFGRG